jgi:hypothetical protein
LSPIRTSTTALTALCGIVVLAGGIAAADSNVSITLNGAPLALNPGPEERDGRVFVPLRGVFERLGASVVYQSGTITAQGNGHSVQLQIGSTQATVDGQAQTLDVAPFIIGDSTYVPLRFISQALGAGVNYDSSQNLVALSSGPQQPTSQQRDQQQQQQAHQQQLDQQQAQQQAQNQQQQQRQAQLDQQAAQQRLAPPQRSSLNFTAEHPGNDETVSARRPTVEADFGNGQADPNSIRVDIDGLNVTDQSSRSPRGVVFSPPSDLQAGRHTVTVSGKDAHGLPFDTHWAFVSGTTVVSNTITNLRPGNDSYVGGQFNVSGSTMPGARVVVQVGLVQRRSENVLGQLLGVNGDNSVNVRSEVIADGRGNFRVPITIDAHQGQTLTLIVDSTDAQTQSAAPRVVRNLTEQ